MEQGDRTIYVYQNARFVKVAEPPHPEWANFIIVCEFGDWSGYRTLAECEKQFPQLEARKEHNWFFRVVER